MYRKGLRYYFEKTAGAGIKWRIQAFGLELKYAWQRAWKGYADSDVWDITDTIIGTLPMLLREYRDTHHTLFIDETTGHELTKEETEEVIDQLIFYLENCDEDIVYERLFGVDPFKEHVFNKARWQQANNECQRCKNEAMALLSKWLWQLWD